MTSSSVTVTGIRRVKVHHWNVSEFMSVRDAGQKRDTKSMWARCWSSVEAGGSTLGQRRFNVSCLPRRLPKTSPSLTTPLLYWTPSPDVKLMLGQRLRLWPNISSTLGRCLLFAKPQLPHPTI